MMIILPILNLSKFQPSHQFAKMKEELEEVELEMYNREIDECDEELLSECFDLIQATMGLMLMIADKKEIEVAGARHFEKLCRRGWLNEGMVEVKFK